MSMLLFGFPALDILGKLPHICVQHPIDMDISHNMMSFNIWPILQFVQARYWNALPQHQS